MGLALEGLRFMLLWTFYENVMRMVIKYSPKVILYRWSTKYMFCKNTKNAREMSVMKFSKNLQKSYTTIASNISNLHFD